MPDPLDHLRHQTRDASDGISRAILWACVLEATAPKAGNVYPGRSFHDLKHSDFVIAAEIVAAELTAPNRTLSERMLTAVQQTVAAVGSNANLGIVLLLGPLVEADRQITVMENGDQERPGDRWLAAIRSVLDALDDRDGQSIYRAIAAAAPGGLGTADEQDVRTTSGPIDLLAAMRQAADRDRIARQYATGFADLIQHVVPLVASAIESAGDILVGISHAHLRLLAADCDTLISRKMGAHLAAQVRQRAAQVNIDDLDQVVKFDQWLRADGHCRNPGTTADLIAASLYLLLRS
jgi:triphosphoribosyl-dephospho-CoA synthase